MKQLDNSEMCITFPLGTICLKLVYSHNESGNLIYFSYKRNFKNLGWRQIFQMDTIFSLCTISFL